MSKNHFYTAELQPRGRATIVVHNVIELTVVRKKHYLASSQENDCIELLTQDTKGTKVLTYNGIFVYRLTPQIT